MTIARGFWIVLVSAVAFGVAGAAIGLCLAFAAPDYYRGVFGAVDKPNFDPVAVGIGLGLSQGLIAGLVVGCVVVLAVAWYRSRVSATAARD